MLFTSQITKQKNDIFYKQLHFLKNVNSDDEMLLKYFHHGYIQENDRENLNIL